MADKNAGNNKKYTLRQYFEIGVKMAKEDNEQRFKKDRKKNDS